jgi:hypothetical protein
VRRALTLPRRATLEWTSSWSSLTGASSTPPLPPRGSGRRHGRWLQPARPSSSGATATGPGAIELAAGRPVLYSLGNLIFDLTRSEETVEGVIVEITFLGARPAQIRLHPTVMVDLVQPNLLDPAGDGAVVIKRMRTASGELTEP